MTQLYPPTTAADTTHAKASAAKRLRSNGLPEYHQRATKQRCPDSRFSPSTGRRLPSEIKISGHKRRPSGLKEAVATPKRLSTCQVSSPGVSRKKCTVWSDPKSGPAGCAVCVPQGEVDPSFHGPGAATNQRRMPLKTKELIALLNPLLRGWGEYYKRAHVRTLFHRLDGWIVRRIWSHRYKHWRNAGWKRMPPRVLYREHGLVNLIDLIPSLASRKTESS
jgi:Group II intron, maturase-specific domain